MKSFLVMLIIASVYFVFAAIFKSLFYTLTCCFCVREFVNIAYAHHNNSPHMSFNSVQFLSQIIKKIRCKTFTFNKIK